MLDTVVLYGDDVCCSVVFGTLVGVFVLILVFLCGYQCTSAREWSVEIDDVLQITVYCIQCCMSMSAVLWCMDVLSRGAI